MVYGADVNDADVERVRIDAVGATFGPGLNDGYGRAMVIRGGTVRDLEVDFDLAGDTSGVRVIGATDLEDVDITSPLALSSDPEAQPDPVTVTARRLRLRSDRPLTIGDGHLELSDAVLDARAMEPDSEFGAAWVVDGRFDPTSLTMDRVTIFGNGDPTSSALGVDGQGAVPGTLRLDTERKLKRGKRVKLAEAECDRRRPDRGRRAHALAPRRGSGAELEAGPQGDRDRGRRRRRRQRRLGDPGAEARAEPLITRRR